MRPLTELRCACPTMTGWQSQGVCGRALTPWGEERLLIATHLAFRWFGVLIRGLEERALRVRGPIKFIIDEIEWLTGGRSGRKFLFGKIFVGVPLLYGSLLYSKSHFTSSSLSVKVLVHWIRWALKTATLRGTQASINYLRILATRPASSEDSSKLTTQQFFFPFFKLRLLIIYLLLFSMHKIFHKCPIYELMHTI